jgi:hypothetical protein
MMESRGFCYELIFIKNMAGLVCLYGLSVLTMAIQESPLQSLLNFGTTRVALG